MSGEKDVGCRGLRWCQQVLTSSQSKQASKQATLNFCWVSFSDPLGRDLPIAGNVLPIHLVVPRVIRSRDRCPLHLEFAWSAGEAHFNKAAL